ncbi:MAG: hypothetical protein M3179_02465 [Actinomycetota bacterium]|nr:hypothetical protein [Actinomycetota bacterium]
MREWRRPGSGTALEQHGMHQIGEVADEVGLPLRTIRHRLALLRRCPPATRR